MVKYTISSVSILLEYLLKESLWMPASWWSYSLNVEHFLQTWLHRKLLPNMLGLDCSSLVFGWQWASLCL